MADIKDDPFATLAQTDEKPAKKATTKKAEAVEDTKAADGMVDLAEFLNAMTIEEDDFKPPTEYVSYYRKPAADAWVPLRIVDVRVEQRETNAVVAYTKSGEMITNPVGIDKLVKDHGGTEQVESVEMWQFVVEAEHISPIYGERSYPYRMYTRIFPARIAYRTPKKGKLGWDSNAGRKLIAATRVLQPGSQVEDNEEYLTELAQKMIGREIMAQVKHRPKEYTDATPRQYENGTPVKALLDEDGASFVKLIRDDAGSFFYQDGGEAYDGDTASLIPFNDAYLIPDNSDEGLQVNDISTRTVYFDNLKDEVAVMPGRTVKIHRTDGSEVTGELTWESVGFVALQTVKAGVMVQADVEGVGILTASWLGTHWQETADRHGVELDDNGNIVFVAAKSDDEVPGGLDHFKGDDES